MTKKLILTLCLSLLLIGCYKEDPAAVKFQIQTSNMCKKWKIDKAMTSTSFTNFKNMENGGN